MNKPTAIVGSLALAGSALAIGIVYTGEDWPKLVQQRSLGTAYGVRPCGLDGTQKQWMEGENMVQEWIHEDGRLEETSRILYAVPNGNCGEAFRQKDNHTQHQEKHS